MRLYLKIFVLLVVTICPVIVKGQINYSKGYVITLKGDTLFGYIADRGEIGNAELCRFRQDKSKKSIEYNPADIQSYRFVDGKYYKSIEVLKGGEYIAAFAEVLFRGEVSLYYYPANENVAYYVETESGRVVGLLNELVKIKNTSASAYYSRKANMFEIESYKDSLDFLFKNCPELKPKIEELEYDTKPLINITREYNNCIGKKNDYQNYEKDLEVSDPSFGVFSGAQISQIDFQKSKILSGYLVSMPVGIFYNVPVSPINENISFQAELMYRRLNYKNDFYNVPLIYTEINIQSQILSLPLLVKYKIPMNRLSFSVGIGKEFAYVFGSKVNTVPYTSGDISDMAVVEFELREKGFTLHHTQKEGWFLDLGLDYKMNPTFSVYSNIRLQSNLNLIIEEESYTNSQFRIAEGKNKLINPHSNVYRTNSAALFVGIRF
jgi:hypothetical protein